MRGSGGKSVAVGFFDGVHLGHRAILAGADAALTFSRHPLGVVRPGSEPRLIMPLDERIAAIRDCGVGEVMVLDFTTELSRLSPDEFAALHLSAFAEIRCGGDWRFGRGGEGDADWLRAHGYSVSVVPFAEYGGERISSSRIRECLSVGDVESANAMLGRRYSVSGVPCAGKGAGAALGFPTVNLAVDAAVARGVYEVVAGGVHALANYGTAPTFGDSAWREPVLEVHFPGTKAPPSFDRVEFLRFLRPERRFGSLEELKAQIAADCATILA